MLRASRKKQHRGSIPLSKAEVAMVVRKLVSRLMEEPGAQECLSSLTPRHVSSSVNDARKPRSDLLHGINLAHALYLDHELSTL